MPSFYEGCGCVLGGVKGWTGYKVGEKNFNFLKILKVKIVYITTLYIKYIHKYIVYITTLQNINKLAKIKCPFLSLVNLGI